MARPPSTYTVSTLAGEDRSQRAAAAANPKEAWNSRGTAVSGWRRAAHTASGFRGKDDRSVNVVAAMGKLTKSTRRKDGGVARSGLLKRPSVASHAPAGWRMPLTLTPTLFLTPTLTLTPTLFLTPTLTLPPTLTLTLTRRMPLEHREAAKRFDERHQQLSARH